VVFSKSFFKKDISGILFGTMFQIISGTSKTVLGTQNVERIVPITAHTNVPTNSVLLGTLFLLVFPVSSWCVFERNDVEDYEESFL
jgi:hypothetical protein